MGDMILVNKKSQLPLGSWPETNLKPKYNYEKTLFSFTAPFLFLLFSRLNLFSFFYFPNQTFSL